MNNPWLGLSSYTEESLKYYQFNGRTTAIASLASIVRQNLFVTLYGRSGIGKTSLLQAGVFPLLRREGYSPLSIRLNNLEDGAKASEIIWNKILDTLRGEGYIYCFCDDEDKYDPDFSDVLVLRKLFSAGRFLNSKSEEAIPIIVIDQFEEVLYKAPATSRLLISQLYALIDDNYNLVISHPNWHDDTNFRIIVSIREDDLFLFEDYIDTLNCIDFKANRYRLLPLSDNEAKEVVLNPIRNKNVFEEGNEEAIAEEIVRLSKNNGQSINTLLLSLICYVLFDNSKSHDKNISVSDLESYRDIIESYYKEVTKNLPKEQRYYIEDHLIDDQGRRISIYTEDLEKYAPLAKQLIGNSNHQLLTETQGRVEFIHDQLAASVMKIRNSRKSRVTKRLGILALVIILVAIFIFSFSQPTKIWNTDYYKSSRNLISDVDVTSFNIKLDSIYCIDDCPSLKSIYIDGTGLLLVSNCPSLVDIKHSEDYKKTVFVINCPNIDKENITALDATFNMRYTTYVLNAENCNDYLECFNRVYKYDSITHSLFIYNDPIVISKGTKYKIESGLSDSIKRKTDCFVPYGQKGKYSRLIEYQSFRSIEELPINYNWYKNISGMIGFFKVEKFWVILTLLGLFGVQCFFWIISYSDYKSKYKNKIAVFYLSFIYGIGMSLLAIVSFMAFYWSMYNLILPGIQIVASIIGAIGCLLCMFIVYKNSFYSLAKYLKNLLVELN